MSIASAHANPKRRSLYSYVPKGRIGNIRWRRRVLQEASNDRSMQKQLVTACLLDVLFYLNAFAWVYSPNQQLYPSGSRQPFLTYPRQDEVILAVKDALRVGYDLLIEKARDQGATWCVLAAFEHEFHFFDHKSLLVGSRKEEYVEKKGDPKALFSKLDFLWQHQPRWLCPEIERKNLSAVNLERSSVIDGESTNADFGRGDRRTGIMLDEYAADRNGHLVDQSTANTSPCRVFNSTYKGTGDAFYAKSVDGHTRKISMPWTEHPEQRRGLYSSAGGELIVHDQDYEFPEDYEFVLDGKVRSPYYDTMCRRFLVPTMIASELDMDPRGAQHTFFDADQVQDAADNDARPPVAWGQIDRTTDQLVVREDGPAAIWFELEAGGRPPLDRDYSVGVDISAGTGASVSAIEVIDNRTGEQVFEYASATIRPADLGDIAVSICRWFGGAFLAWEANGGPGRNFGDRVFKELGYRNVYYRMKADGEESDVPGWWSDAATKLSLLEQLRQALHTRAVVLRSPTLVRELPKYIYTGSQDKVDHVDAVNTQDPTGAGASHGDRVIAIALAHIAAKARGAGLPPGEQREKQEREYIDPLEDPESRSKATPYFSPAWRHWREKELQEAEEW